MDDIDNTKDIETPPFNTNRELQKRQANDLRAALGPYYCEHEATLAAILHNNNGHMVVKLPNFETLKSKVIVKITEDREHIEMRFL